ncbi:hypothetical protein PL321_10445 [Caloramator sp. mosi_1]|uniref:hypothetical protein n=1 Tax=Caloramator sp. mosi_1 TaxID=3023090 RepID=UPI002360F231|nr:hypothetical protein [Caloramator sp. mosi_1]WDC83215.1 hypothetical protein PL321_10445 [Caloramator sp. mosi_1]
MLKNGKIEKNPNVNKDDQRTISSIVFYFESRQGIDKLKYVPKDFNTSKMNEVFGFNYEMPYLPKEQYFYFRIPQNSLIDIKGYDYFIQLNSYSQEVQNSKEFSFKYYNSTAQIAILKNNKEIYRKSIKDIIQTNCKKYGTERPDKELSINELSIIDENENIKVRIILNNVSGRIDENDNVNIDGCEFLIMLNAK